MPQESFNLYPSVDNLTREINRLNYADKNSLFSRCFSLSFISEDLNDKLLLISLIALSVKNIRNQAPSMTTLEFLLKLTNISPDYNSIEYKFLENLSIIVNDFTYGVHNIDTFGFTNSKEILQKIKTLINSFLPF